jgi:hypothetical protein
MRLICASLIATLAAAVPAAQQPAAAAADAFAAKLKDAIDAHDSRGVAALVQFPITVVAGPFRIPIADASTFVKTYDSFFTPTFRCRVTEAIAAHQVTSTPEGVSIAGSAIYAAGTGGRFKVTRLLVPTSPPAPSLPAPRPVVFTGRPAQFLGRLERDDYDRFTFQATARQRLDVTITGFRGRDAAIRVVDQKTGAPVPTNLHVGPRTWSGVLPATAGYRVEIARTAPYCDPAFQYQLTLTLGPG